MTTTVDDIEYRGRLRSREFQKDVALYLRDVGLTDARPAQRATKTNPRPATPDDHGDVVGVPGWSLIARARFTETSPGTMLAIAEKAAVGSGTPRVAAVIHRRGRDVEDSCVVVSLTDFADMVVRLEAVDSR